MSVRELLERDRELTLLDEALHAAQAGTGSAVLVHGEAGIGKASVVRAFARRLPDRVRLLAGACDDLVTPRTLRPVRGSGPLAAALAAVTGTRCSRRCSPTWTAGGRPCSCWRTSSGPTTPPTTCCATSGAGWWTCRSYWS